MNKSIANAKLKLTIIFSVIVFLCILIMGMSFFSVKYYNELNISKKNFSSFVKDIQEGKMSINQIMELGSKIDKNFLNNKYEEKKGGPGRLPMSYLLIDNNESIIKSNIDSEINEVIILGLYSTKSSEDIVQYGNFLVRKFYLEDNSGVLVLFDELRYTTSDYISDLLGFLFINLFSSFIIYFIGFIFVKKTFIPIENNMKDMKDFVQNAGHELKTPLSVIDSNIQIIDDIKSYDPEMTAELKFEVLRLNSIIDGLIKLSNIEVLKSKDDNNLKNIILEIIKEFDSKLIDKKIKVNINIKNNLIIEANKDYFYIFISNLIGNSIKYNKNKGTIDIDYIDCELIIKDSGIGISKENIDKIYNRFYQADKSRNTNGFGIGLSLVKKIANIYKWKIKVESEVNKGTKFIITF